MAAPFFHTTSEALKMEEMSTFEMVLVGAIVVLVLFWVGPGIKPMLAQSRQAENPDWAGLLVPIIAVILFVILLISMV